MPPAHTCPPLLRMCIIKAIKWTISGPCRALSLYRNSAVLVGGGHYSVILLSSVWPRGSRFFSIFCTIPPIIILLLSRCKCTCTYRSIYREECPVYRPTRVTERGWWRGGRTAWAQCTIIIIISVVLQWPVLYCATFVPYDLNWLLFSTWAMTFPLRRQKRT